MKTCILWPLILFSVMLTGQQRFVQGGQAPIKTNTSACYLGFATGINNYSGLLGFEVEVPVHSRLSLFAVGGVGGWGYKLGGGLQYYLKKPQFGSSLSLGYTAAFGLSEPLKFEESDSQGNASGVVHYIKLNTASTINFLYHYNFHVGSGNKIALGGGWAIPLQQKPYELVGSNSPNGLSTTSQTVMEILQPGGFVISFKFLFGI